MKRNAYILLVFVLLCSCKKPYAPAVIATNNNNLVVEGVINTGSDSTVIRLSHTVQLSSTIGSQPETGATVVIFSDAGSSYPLTETGNGYYKAPPLNLTSSNKYGLKIMTTGGKAYQSDLVVAKNSPPIDSVYYRIESDGLRVYADTHDPANNTKYYRWDFEETYEFHSAFQSFDYLSTTPIDTVLPRTLDQHIFICWRGDVSSTILLNSSAKLAKDVITDNPITFIASSSEKIATRYSILVKQYALTTDAYNYFQQLKKNTEKLGSIFDPQPSELPGNIHCVSDPTETVLGYITAGSPTETRIFISNRVLPAWQSITAYTGCKMDTALYCAGKGCDNQVAEEIYAGFETPLYPILKAPGSKDIIGYAIGSPGCVDCTLRGTTKQPIFWINE